MITPALPRIDGIALVLEDAMIVAYDAAAMLSEFGALDVVVCATLSDAMERIRTGLRPALALLDIDLGGETSLEAACALNESAVPIIYSTGYEANSELLTAFPRGEMLLKPYTAEDIAKALQSLGFLTA